MENKIKNLPNALQHKIIGFTYVCPSKELLEDIRSYYTDFEIVKDCYFIASTGSYAYNMNIYLLHYDMCEFCNDCNIISDTSYLKNRNFTKKIYFQIPERTPYGKERETYKKIREMWGILSPELRTRFINEYKEIK